MALSAAIEGTHCLLFGFAFGATWQNTISFCVVIHESSSPPINFSLRHHFVVVV
jgi:hypothetical protein